MVFDHRVKFKGVLYDIGENVPCDTEKPVETANTKPQTVSEMPEVEENKIEYTKTEINRMSTADLKKLAKENGLDESMSGAEIKKELIKKFEL